jgi:signal transduction histidine kinase
MNILNLSGLRARLLFTYVGLSIIGLGGLTIFAGQQLSRSAFQDYANNLKVNALIVAGTLSGTFHEIVEEGGDLSQVTVAVARLATNANARVTLINTAGDAWMDTSGKLPTQNMLQDPEIVGAVNNTLLYDQRFDENGVLTIYTAAEITDDRGLIGYVRLSAPASVPQTAVRQRWLVLGLGFLFTTFITLLVSLRLSATISRPLAELRNKALEMAGGQLNARIADPGQDEIGEVARAFNQMADQVENMLEQQSAFASNASHELRTPLTTIRLRTEELVSGQLDPALSSRYIREIDGEIKRLSRLVEDLLLLSQLESPGFIIGAEQTDPARLAAAVIRELNPQERGLKAHFETGEDLQPIQANTNHFRLVLRNLLENAVKYTPEGGEITCHLSRENTFLKVEVADTGLGIAQADLSQVTRRFFRGDKAHSRQVKGIGLGLSLVQSAVLVYGGRFEIESPGEGKGATATVWWPFAQQGQLER